MALALSFLTSPCPTRTLFPHSHQALEPKTAGQATGRFSRSDQGKVLGINKLVGKRQPEASASDVTSDEARVHEHAEEAKTMITRNQGSQSAEPHFPEMKSGAPLGTLLTVTGDRASIEGNFKIADSLHIECEIGGQLDVGGRLVIGERGVVSADVKTVDALIMGTYEGNMIATGNVEIAATGRVIGNIHTDSLVIEKGGFFNGNVHSIEKKDVRGKEPAQQQSARPVEPPKRKEVLESVTKALRVDEENGAEPASADYGEPDFLRPDPRRRDR